MMLGIMAMEMAIMTKKIKSRRKISNNKGVIVIISILME